MNFTLTVPKNWNYTPADLMRKFAGNDCRYIATYDQYFTNVLYDQKTGKEYVYDHLSRKVNNINHTETVTVFLKEKTTFTES